MHSARWKCAATATTAAAAVASYRLVVRPWQAHWGATDEEAAASLPGDELVGEPAVQATRAVTVDASPEEVWPWVVQLGADRGGFYSYERLENLFGLGIRNADAVVAEWQRRAVGDLVAADSHGRGGWYVMDVHPNELLVLQLADVRRGRPVWRTDPAHWEFLWTFALRPAGNGATRLVVRERAGFANVFVRLLFSPLGPISFVMSRKMLLGLKSRAEAGRRRPITSAPSAPSVSSAPPDRPAATGR